MCSSCIYVPSQTIVVSYMYLHIVMAISNIILNYLIHSLSPVYMCSFHRNIILHSLLPACTRVISKETSSSITSSILFHMYKCVVSIETLSSITSSISQM